MTSNKFIIKAWEGVKVLTINDLNSNLYSVQNLLDYSNYGFWTDRLALLASGSHIIIAISHMEKLGESWKKSIQVMKKAISEI
jgi:hypothetical protein